VLMFDIMTNWECKDTVGKYMECCVPTIVGSDLGVRRCVRFFGYQANSLK
jgi:hypothetical protein